MNLKRQYTIAIYKIDNIIEVGDSRSEVWLFIEKTHHATKTGDETRIIN